MNYVSKSLGTIPDYLEFTLNSILTVDKDATVFLCTDHNNKEDFKNVKYIHPKTLENDKIQEFKSLGLYKNTIFESNPLWQTSLLRIFYLESLRLELNLSSFIHFDNDVIIYKPYEALQNVFVNNRLNITRQDDKRFIFGYSFFAEIDFFPLITDKIIDFANYGNSYNWSFHNGKPYNEMEFLGKIFQTDEDFFNCLPILPYESNLLFDSSSYGQYLDGTHMHPKTLISGRYADLNHYIGTEIISKRIKVKFNNNKPKVLWRDKSFDVANLHIHSKRLHKFLPPNYKNYV